MVGYNEFRESFQLVRLTHLCSLNGRKSQENEKKNLINFVTITFCLKCKNMIFSGWNKLPNSLATDLKFNLLYYIKSTRKLKKEYFFYNNKNERIIAASERNGRRTCSVILLA